MDMPWLWALAAWTVIACTGTFCATIVGPRLKNKKTGKVSKAK